MPYVMSCLALYCLTFCLILPLLGLSCMYTFPLLHEIIFEIDCCRRVAGSSVFWVWGLKSKGRAFSSCMMYVHLRSLLLSTKQRQKQDKNKTDKDTWSRHKHGTAESGQKDSPLPRLWTVLSRISAPWFKGWGVFRGWRDKWSSNQYAKIDSFWYQDIKISVCLCILALSSLATVLILPSSLSLSWLVLS